jgi:acetolactate synthase-1/2/3 large subunit
MTLTAAAALLARLRRLGVEHIFANSGTDFPPLIEALAATGGPALPQAHVMPHESCAMAMAHGYWLATGRAQAVMAHTNVGLANCAIGAINAATERVPILLFSGRTPVTEKGRLGARTVPIGWGQEMRDQAALVREAVKWDFELRFPEQVVELIDHAWAIANSTPKGPIYLSLPREVLCEPCPAALLDAPPAMAPAIAAPEPGALRAAATILAAAERPLIIAQRGAGSPEAFSALGALAEAWGIPVVQYWATRLAVATDHPMAVGADPEPWLGEADAILVIDSLAPWSPDIHRLRADCRVIQLGPDPLEARFPVRDFRCDVALVGETADAILALAAAMRPLGPGEAVERRRHAVAARAAAIRAGTRAAATAGCRVPMTKAWVSHCLSQAVAGRDVTVLSELGCPLGPLDLGAHGGWYQEPHSGGLGWAFPAGLGIRLAAPRKLVVATMGDGAYIFSNPVACHQIAEALSLPVLVLVLDNGEWGAVRQSVLGLFPDGAAARANRMPLTSLRPTPSFRKVAEASRAFALHVERGEDLPGALAAALAHIDHERGHALLHIAVAP